MYNDRISNEEAKERISQRMKEVESYSRENGIGSGRQITRWFVVLVILVAVVAAVGLLL